MTENKKLRYSTGEFDGEYVLPIKFFDSSVSGGYSDFVVTNIGRNISICNLHFEKYDVSSVKSTYTDRFNGIQSRKNDIGATERVESFSLELSPTEIQFNSPEGRVVVDKGFPGIISSVNVRSTTSSFGNYAKSHDLLSGVENNLLVNFAGSIPSTQENACVSGSIDFEIPVRNRNKSQIITRFSSPGAINETSQGYLDFATSQYSVYSTINYRNKFTRRQMAKENSKHFDLNDFFPVEEVIEDAIPSFVTFAWEADTITVGDGNAITTWTDSIAGKDLAQTTPSSKPLFRADTNGSPAVEFDGIASHLLSTDVDITGLMDDPAVPNFTSIVVLSNRHSASAVTNWAVAGGNSASNNAIFGLAQGTSSNDQNYLRSNSASSNVATFSPAATSAKRAVTLRTETTGATFEVFLNGTSVVSGASPSVFTIDRFCVGAVPRISVSNYTTASVHAIYLINTNASTGQLDEIWTYIRNKWGTP